MTHLLEQAFQMASQLSEAEQDAIAEQLMADIRAEDEWDAKFAATQDALATLASQAIAEKHAGHTKPLLDDSDLAHD